jgi:CheY-like chemotaxis protein
MIKKVLLVDDSAPGNFLSRILLKEYGLEALVDEVLDGASALEYILACEECPDVILLDINMPVMDGFQFLEEFEKRSKCVAHTKIFMLTSSQREEDKIVSLENKLVEGYFDKPLSKQHFDLMVSAI